MTLGQRLLVSTGLLVVVTTLALGLGVREAWRKTELEQFQEQFESATRRLRSELSEQTATLQTQVAPICENPVVDSALVDLQTSSLDAGRKLSLSLRVDALQRSQPLDELVLLTDRGEILGAGHDKALVGTRNRDLARAARRFHGKWRYAGAQGEGSPQRIESYCVLERGGRWVAVYGARHLDKLLDRISVAHGIPLHLGKPRRQENVMELTVRLPELGSLALVATRSRVPLNRALRQLDATILGLGAATFALALILSWVISRGLARPIVELADQARAAVGSEPKPVKARGGRELEQFADSFNAAIADLVALRKRLAATERIAAQREIAQRVAHEIKNPLAPIRAAVETLRRLRARNDPAFDEYFDEASRTVLNEVQRITTIVQQFTRFARLPPPNPQWVDIASTVREVVALHNTGSTQVRFEADASVEAYVDRDQLVQVVTNLVQNAMDAVADVEHPQVDVQITQPTADEVMLVVRDNGPGVSDDVAQRLFEPYVTGKADGTGLGLAIVQRIVIEHGGEISFRNVSPTGALFEVQLPISGPTGSLPPSAPKGAAAS